MRKELLRLKVDNLIYNFDAPFFQQDVPRQSGEEF